MTKLYDEGFFHEKKVKSSGCNVVIWEGTSFQCAKEFLNGNDTVAVLNFANPFEPGGGVCRGSRTQEECLCRCSNLFNCISQPRIIEGYYNYHNADKHNYLFSDKFAYSPEIVVFKDDSTYEILHDSFLVDVITCSAPYNMYGNDTELLKETYTNQEVDLLHFINDVDVFGKNTSSGIYSSVCRAINAAWTTEGSRRRHIIIVLTNTSGSVEGNAMDIRQISSSLSYR